MNDLTPGTVSFPSWCGQNQAKNTFSSTKLHSINNFQLKKSRALRTAVYAVTGPTCFSTYQTNAPIIATVVKNVMGSCTCEQKIQDCKVRFHLTEKRMKIIAKLTTSTLYTYKFVLQNLAKDGLIQDLC